MNTTENSDNSKYVNTGYYKTPDLSQRLDLITHLLANTALIPFVQASEGSGKTRLYYHLAETLVNRYTVFPVNGSDGETPGSMQSRLTTLLGLETGVDDEALHKQICSSFERKTPLLILIDDAEQIAPDALAWLIGLINNPTVQCKSKCVVMSAVDVLALPLGPVLVTGLKDAIQTLDIPPVSAEQLPGFVASIDPIKSALLEQEHYHELMKNSSGNIGKLLWQLQYVNNAPMPQQEMSATSASRMNPLYVVAGILLVSALVSILIFQDEINENLSQNIKEEKQTELEIRSLPLPQPVVAVTETVQQPEREITEEKAEIPEETAESQSLAKTPVVTTEQKVESAIIPAELPDKESPATEMLSEQPETQLAVTEAPSAQVADVKAPVSNPVAEEVPKAPPVMDSKQLEKPVQAEPESEEMRAPEEKLAANKPPEEKKLEQSVFKPVDWLINQSDKSYTLQLLAVSEEKGIKRFLQLHKIQGNLVVMETRRDGKPWYALLYGAYASRDDALNARDSLPATYKSSGAWPRSILSIRQAIEAK